MGTRISARVCDEIAKELRRYARQTGVSESRLIEDALAHHLRALRELPANAIAPVRIALSVESGHALLDALEREPAPKDELRRLMKR